MWKAESVSKFSVVNLVRIFALIILNIIPEAELCKQIREATSHFIERMLLTGRKVKICKKKIRENSVSIVKAINTY